MVKDHGGSLVGIAKVAHTHRDQLSLSAVKTSRAGHRQDLSVGAPNEVILFRLRPRDGQCVRRAVEDAKPREQAIPELTYACNILPVWPLLAANLHTTLYRLRVGSDEGVDILHLGSSLAVECHENSVQARYGPSHVHVK